MLTDDDVRDRFHALLEPALRSVRPDPSLLSDVRRRHHRRARTVVAVTVTGVAAAGSAAAVVAVARTGHGPGRAVLDQPSPTPTQPTPATTVTVHGPSVVALDWTFELPVGFEVTRQTHVVHLASASPPQPVAGTTASFTAEGGAGGDASIDVTIYRGPIAAGEATAEPPAPDAVRHTTIAGHEATFDPYGGPGSELLEVRVQLSDNELLFAQTAGLSGSQIRSILASALT